MHKQQIPHITFNKKYRPSDLSEVVSHETLVKTISNAISYQKLANAYLFTGMRGVGKTSMARIISKTINCKNQIAKNSIHPCNVCLSCKSYDKQNHPDIIEIDAASHTGIDDIRIIIENAEYKPIIGNYKVYIIDEIHMLSKSAFNALLKILEEPPQHLIFIFATTEINKIPLTIVSRCQRFDLKKLPILEIENHLKKVCKKENIKYELNGINEIAKKSEGSMREALSLLEQISTLINPEEKITQKILFKISNASCHQFCNKLIYYILKLQTKEAIDLIEEIEKNNTPLKNIINNLLDIISSLCKKKLIENYSGSEIILSEEIEQTAKKYDLIKLTILWQVLFDAISDLQNEEMGIILLEMIIIKMICTLNFTIPNEIKTNLITKTNSDENITPNKNNIITDNQELSQLIKYLNDEKHFELYYYLMNNIELISYEKDNMHILEDEEDSTKLKTLLENTIKKRNKLFKIHSKKVEKTKINSLKKYLLNQLIDSLEWKNIVQFFPSSKIKDILYENI